MSARGPDGSGIILRCAVALAAAGALAGAVVTAQPSALVIDDWSGARLQHHGVPPGWQAESWGRRALFDLTIVDDGGRRALLMKSRDDRSTIRKDVRGRIDLKATPVLTWSWKVVALPPGGDARRWETTDQAAQLYVAWERFPSLLRSRVIGYAWDSSVPAGTIVPSQKTSTVTYVIVRSGPAELGHWLTERRNVAEDYRRIFGEGPDRPAAVSLSIDSNDTHSSAEALFGAISFVRAGPQ